MALWGRPIRIVKRTGTTLFERRSSSFRAPDRRCVQPKGRTQPRGVTPPPLQSADLRFPARLPASAWTHGGPRHTCVDAARPYQKNSAWRSRRGGGPGCSTVDCHRSAGLCCPWGFRPWRPRRPPDGSIPNRIGHIQQAGGVRSTASTRQAREHPPCPRISALAT